jgi:thymidine phosphorylase
VGNALEIRECVRFLKGETVPDDLAYSARAVAVRLLGLKGVEKAEQKVESALSSGGAFEKFREFVAAQGGDGGAVERLQLSPLAAEVEALETGYVAGMDALSVGNAALAMGAGRQRKGEEIDSGAGVEALVKVGERVEVGQPVARLYGGKGVERAEELVRGGMKVAEEPVEAPAAILESL